MRVSKSASKLYLLNHGQVFASYPVALGRGDVGPKQREGDHRTPEGKYVLDSKNEHSAFYKAFHISYPNDRDRELAKRRGVAPGGNVEVHGQRNGFAWAQAIVQNFDWTYGCIALRNEDMDAVVQAVDSGTPIEIDP